MRHKVECPAKVTMRRVGWLDRHGD